MTASRQDARELSSLFLSVHHGGLSRSLRFSALVLGGDCDLFPFCVAVVVVDFSFVSDKEWVAGSEVPKAEGGKAEMACETPLCHYFLGFCLLSSRLAVCYAAGCW
jgi:hypothetical protein